jgi:hypothetical protein
LMAGRPTRDMYDRDMPDVLGVHKDALDALEAGFEGYDHKFDRFQGTKFWKYVEMGKRLASLNA